MTKVLKLNGNIKLSTITRVEIIDHNGRSYVNKKDKLDVEISIQDDGQTLKIFTT